MLKFISHLIWGEPSDASKRKLPQAAAAKRVRVISDDDQPRDLNILAQHLNANPYPYLPEWKKDDCGLYFALQGKQIAQDSMLQYTHHSLLELVKTKYNPEVLSPDVLRFKSPQVSAGDCWLSYSVIKAFANKLNLLYPGFLHKDLSSEVDSFFDSIKNYAGALEAYHSQRADDDLIIGAPVAPDALIQTHKNELESKTHLGISANDGSHYYVFLVDIRNKQQFTILGTDSLGFLTKDSKYFDSINDYLKTLYPDARIERQHFVTPNQGNTWDCGVVVCAMMEKFAAGEFGKDFIKMLALYQGEVFNYAPYRQRIAGMLAMDDEALPKLKHQP